jgi:hypothetical protein
VTHKPLELPPAPAAPHAPLPELREGTEQGDVPAFLRLLAQIARRQATRREPLARN